MQHSISLCILSFILLDFTRTAERGAHGRQKHDPRVSLQLLSLLTRLRPGRQVLRLQLPFCIVGSDGTGDALYCEPDIGVPQLQSGGQMDAACAPCLGIKRKTNRAVPDKPPANFGSNDDYRH